MVKVGEFTWKGWYGEFINNVECGGADTVGLRSNVDAYLSPPTVWVKDSFPLAAAASDMADIMFIMKQESWPPVIKRMNEGMQELCKWRFRRMMRGKHTKCHFITRASLLRRTNSPMAAHAISGSDAVPPIFPPLVATGHTMSL